MAEAELRPTRPQKVTKMEKNTDEQVLEQAGLRVTAVRLLVWRTLRHELHDAFSLADLEEALATC